MRSIDLNCDLGESYGHFTVGDDAGIMPYISSANIGCGFHGGDPSVIRRAVRLALDHAVAIGAHPSFPDLAGFGLRPMNVPAHALEDLVLYQVAAVAGFARAEGAVLHHVKPHGALYMSAARDAEVARAVAKGVAAFDASLVLYGIGEILEAGRSAGLRVSAEAFAGRVYEPDGWPRTRARPDALLEDAAAVVTQVEKLAKGGEVETADGTVRVIPVDTVCIHVQTSADVALARLLKTELEERGVLICPRDRT